MKSKTEKTQPNIIYILGDDHRQDYTSLGGHKIVQTPNLDALAKEGFYFKNSFCTSPACTPSRACHYTGQWERSHGINFNSDTSISEQSWKNTFPMILKNMGYETAWIGKNHVPVGVGGYRGGFMEKTFDYWYGNHGHSYFYPKDNKNFGYMYQNSKSDTQIEIFEEGAMNFLDPQEEFIKNASYPLPHRDTSKPFCMCITFNLPHSSGVLGMQQRDTDDEIYKSLYRDQANCFQPPHSYVAYEDIKTPHIPKHLYSGVYLEEYYYVRTAEALREMQIRFCQTITGMDRMIGNIRKKLKELQLEENTIIVFSTDHGVHHGEHGIGGKCFLYEEDIKIPLIIYDPRNQTCKGKEIDQIVAVPDLAPTMLELVGVDIPNTMQGCSVAPLLQDKNIPWREELFIEQLMDTQNYPKSEGIRTKEWKYIRYFKRTEDPEDTSQFRKTLDNYDEFLLNSYDSAYRECAYEQLFYLKTDPHEDNNLADQPEFKEQMDYFRKRINEMVKDSILPNHAERILHEKNIEH